MRAASAVADAKGKYVGNRPVKLRKSSWQDRMLDNRDPEETKRMHALKKTKMVPKGTL